MVDSLIGIGLYTSIEASRLLETSAKKINHWLVGYDYTDAEGNSHSIPPLWTPDLAAQHYNQVQLSFRDLMEIRFVEAFRNAKLPLQRIRTLYKQAREVVDNDRPFSTAKFRTDGKTIFLEKINNESEDGDTLDLKNYQHVFKKFIEPTFKDIDYRMGLPVKWYPRNNKYVVLDPTKSFGQPILEEVGIPTATIYNAYIGSKSYSQVAGDYEISVPLVKAAVNFESRLSGI